MTDHDHDEYSTTPEFKLTAEKLTARLKQANLASKTDIANFIKKRQILIIKQKTLHQIKIN